MDAGIDALELPVPRQNHGFEFQLGSPTDIKRDEKRIVLAPIHDESGALVVNEREVAYDILADGHGSVQRLQHRGIKGSLHFPGQPLPGAPASTTA